MAPGLTTPIISAEDLIVTKILAGRPKDLEEDVRGILSAQSGHLALAAARQTLSLLEEALGVSDLIPLLNRRVSKS